MGPNQEFSASRQWSRGLQIGLLGRFSGWYLEQWAPKQQNSSLSSRGKIQHQGVESLNFTRAQEKKLNLCMFLNKLNSYKLTCFGPLSFFVKMYQVILNKRPRRALLLPIIVISNLIFDRSSSISKTFWNKHFFRHYIFSSKRIARIKMCGVSIPYSSQNGFYVLTWCSEANVSIKKSST